MSNKTNSVQSIRYPSLDTLKFLLCIPIVFCHYRTGLLGGDNADISKLPFLPFTFEYGEMAVEFFFIISGFLIANNYKVKIQGGG